MKNAMTVGDLIKYLSTLDKKAVCFVEYEGEFRAVNKTDVRFDPEPYITTNDGDFEDFEGPALLFTSWS